MYDNLVQVQKKTKTKKNKTSDAVYIPRQHMQDNFMTCIFAHIQ